MSRTGRYTEDEKGISKSFQKKERYKPFRVERRAFWGSSMVHSGLHAPKYISFHIAFEGDFWLWNFPHLFTYSIFCPGRSVERMHMLQRGMERKQQTRRRECNECWKCTDTLLKFWPFWQLPASRRHCVRAMTIAFQPVHCLQRSVAISL